MRDVIGYEGRYKVDKFGQIHSLTRNLILKPAKQYEPNGSYYLRVSLTGDEGKQRSFLVHRIVAQAYIENPENKPTVNHKDGDSSNNCVDNLEWATLAEQRNHSIEELSATFRIQSLGYKCKGSASRYRGVTKGKTPNRWRAKFTNDNIEYRLGEFNTEVEAALAYDKAVKTLGFTHRPLNFPNKCPETTESTPMV